MERRGFLMALAAGGTLAGAPLAVAASELRAASGSPAPVLVVCQANLPGASRFADALGAALRDAGVEARRADRQGSELRVLAQIDALLAQGRHGRIVGVMDDAAAVVFQAVAAAHGAAFLLQARHRFAEGGVCHQCRPTGLPGAIAWRDAPERWPAQLAGLYADILAGGPVRGVRAEAAAPTNAGAEAALVSFVLAA